MTTAQLDDDARQQAERELRDGERLLWAGRSDPAVVFAPRDAFLVPFSILWCAFVAFWLFQAATSGAPPLFIVVGSAFAVFGVMFLVGRFFLKASRKRRMVYAVTDRRAFLSTGRRLVQTDVHRDDREVHRSRDGRHVSVVWSVQSFRSSFGNATIWTNSGLDGVFSPMPMAFYDVADVDGLLGALDRAR
jgi:hypothetical protein